MSDGALYREICRSIVAKLAKKAVEGTGSRYPDVAATVASTTDSETYEALPQLVRDISETDNFAIALDRLLSSFDSMSKEEAYRQLSDPKAVKWFTWEGRHEMLQDLLRMLL